MGPIPEGGVALAEQLRAHCLADQRLDLVVVRHQVAQVDRLTGLIQPQHGLFEIDVDTARQGVGDHQGR